MDMVGIPWPCGVLLIPSQVFTSGFSTPFNPMQFQLLRGLKKIYMYILSKGDHNVVYGLTYNWIQNWSSGRLLDLPMFNLGNIVGKILVFGKRVCIC